MSTSSQSSKKDKIFDGRYQIFEIVGRGASSVVYRVKHVLSENKELALKVLLPNRGHSNNSDLLRHESLALITARHKYVIRLEDFRSVDDICYLSMEYASEGNLQTYTQGKGGKLPTVQAERFFTQISEALAFIHNIGMLHRDIKPENILIINERQSRLSDFGVATLPGQTTTLEELKKGIGTLDYMAPEIFTGDSFGAPADVYSLGLAFYEIFTGTHPFKGLPLAKSISARRKSSITPIAELVPDISPKVAETIDRALSVSLEDRFRNAIDLLDFLQKGNASDAAAPVQSPTQQAPAQPASTQQAPTQAAPQAIGKIEPKRIEVPIEKPISKASTPQNKIPEQKIPAERAPNETRSENNTVRETIPISQKPLSSTESKTTSKALDDERRPLEEKSPYSTEDAIEELLAEPEVTEEKIIEPTEEIQTESKQSEVKVESQIESLKDIQADAQDASGIDNFEYGTAIREDSQPLWKRALFFVLMGCVGLLFLNISYKLLFAGNDIPVESASASTEMSDTNASQPQSDSIQATNTNNNEISPTHQNPGSFPHLRQGVYSGSITGLSGDSSPLTFISMPGQNSMAVLVGIPGWQVAKINLKDLSSGQLTAISNGSILNFTLSDSNEGILSGSFNAPNLELNGQWSVSAKQS